MIELLRNVRAKVPNVLLGVIVGLMVGGGAFAVAKTVTDDGVHGGPKPRFHDAKECNLVDVSTLHGNWTHGDYVSAVEKADPSKVREAAHSRCGKPAKGGPKDKSKGKDDSGSSESKGRPSPKPSRSTKAPSPTPSATGSASPVQSVTPTPTGSSSPSPSPSAS